MSVPDAIWRHRRSLAKDGRRRAEVRSICEVGVLDRIISWGEWETLLYAAEECAGLSPTDAARRPQDAVG